MAGVISTGSILRFLYPGLNRRFGEAYREKPEQWKDLVNMETSDQAFEIDQQWEGFGLLPVKPEGDQIAYDSQTSGYAPKYIHLTYAKGFAVTKEALRDNLYNLFTKKARALAFSGRQTIENVVANLYNNGFSGSFTMEGGDGQSLFSTAHPLGPSDSTSNSNELAVPAALSEASLETLLTQIDQAVDPRGLHIDLKPKALIVPPALHFEATRITASVLQNNTGDNAVNAIKYLGYFPDGVKVNNYLSSSTAYFITTDAEEGVKLFMRQEPEFEQDMDFGTSNNLFKMDLRISVGWSDYRGAYGSEGL